MNLYERGTPHAIGDFARIILERGEKEEVFWENLIREQARQIKETARFISFPSMGELSYSDGDGPSLESALRKKYPRGIFQLGYLGTADPDLYFRGVYGITTNGEFVVGRVTIQKIKDEKAFLPGYSLHSVEWRIDRPSVALATHCVLNYFELWSRLGERLENLFVSKRRSADIAESLHVAHVSARAILRARQRP